MNEVNVNVMVHSCYIVVHVTLFCIFQAPFQVMLPNLILTIVIVWLQDIHSDRHLVSIVRAEAQWVRLYQKFVK